MPQPGPNHHIDFSRGNRTALDPPFSQRESCHTQALEPLYQIWKGRTDIHKSAECHVPADSGKAVKMEMQAHRSPSSRLVRPRHLTQGWSERQCIDSRRTLCYPHCGKLVP